jgi:hypothetical protein
LGPQGSVRRALDTRQERRRDQLASPTAERLRSELQRIGPLMKRFFSELAVARGDADD